MDSISPIQRLNNSLIKIIGLYQEIIQEMDRVLILVGRELSHLESDGVVKLSINESNETVKRKLLQIDEILNMIKEEFGLESPIIH